MDDCLPDIAVFCNCGTSQSTAHRHEVRWCGYNGWCVECMYLKLMNSVCLLLVFDEYDW